MSKTENTNTETKQQETTNSKIDISAIDYDALACVIMDAYESDRLESGRKEIVKGIKYTLQKYQTAHDREIIDDMLMNFTGYTLEEDWSGLYFQTHLYLAHEIDEFNRFPDIMNAEFDYRCELVFFPTEAGILAMYFGNDKVRYMLESTKYLKKFFYQNSTECPENISEKEWNYRLETWEKALAPDYIPINHGFQVQLFDTKHIMYTKDLSGIDLPSPETMINGLKGTYKEEEHLLNYPKQGSIIDYMEFYKSQTFKDWQKNVEKDIRKKCHFFTDKSMLSKIIH